MSSGSETIIYESIVGDGPLRQGEILGEVVHVKIDASSLDSASLTAFQEFHPFALIVTQDCDLEWDFNARTDKAKEHKLIPNVLFCMADTATNIRQIGRQHGTINSARWNDIKNNKHERYHFLEAVPDHCDAQGQGIPELGMDFKKYFTIPPEEIYARIKGGEILRRCRLTSPYLEHFATRFAYYQFRVALPEPHRSV